MIEELLEYLTRKGYGEETADDIHMAFVEGYPTTADMPPETMGDEDHDYVDESRKLGKVCTLAQWNTYPSSGRVLARSTPKFLKSLRSTISACTS